MKKIVHFKLQPYKGFGRFKRGTCEKNCTNSNFNSIKFRLYPRVLFADTKETNVNKMVPKSNLDTTMVFADRNETLVSKMISKSNLNTTMVFADRKGMLVN